MKPTVYETSPDFFGKEGVWRHVPDRRAEEYEVCDEYFTGIELGVIKEVMRVFEGSFFGDIFFGVFLKMLTTVII
jgi:hypothetical protein